MSEPSAPRRPKSTARAIGRSAAAFALFAGLAFVRVRPISETFWLLGDQIRDWTIALGAFRDLPLTGTPSVVGGTAIGPIYYWTLWAIRHLIGPWTDNLPHAGGIGLSVIQSAADAMLLTALWRRFESFPLALAGVLLLATAPYDLAISAQIWNPALSVALVKISLAAVLLDGAKPALWWSATAMATAWLAVQAHSSAIFVAAPVGACFVTRQLVARRWADAARAAAAIALIILVLQIPFLLHVAGTGSDTVAPARVIRDVSYTLAHPEAFRLRAAFTDVTGAWGDILLRPAHLSWFGGLFLGCAAFTLFRWHRDPLLLGATVVPPACAMAGFATMQGAFHSYWVVSLAPPVVLTFVAAVAGLPLAARRIVSATAAIGVCLAAPLRVGESLTVERLPEYGALVRGSREIKRYTEVVRSISTNFPLPPSTDPEFLYRVLGGRITPDAEFGVVIRRSGRIAYTQND
jgi:hypothetical protein